MSIKLKLMLAIDALVLSAVVMFGSLLHNSEKTGLQRQAGEARENVLQSLANVTVESVLSEDAEMLINYTAGLKHIIGELETAYVLSGGSIMAHTDKKLSPRQLPLSYSGRRIRGGTDNLLVKTRFVEPDGKDISFSRKTVTVNGKSYDIAVGYSDVRVRAHIKTVLDSVLVRILKAGLLAVSAATLLSLWLSGLLLRPLDRLVRAFIVTGGGNLDYRLNDAGRYELSGRAFGFVARFRGRKRGCDRGLLP